jgi:hypothetical protein
MVSEALRKALNQYGACVKFSPLIEASGAESRRVKKTWSQSILLAKALERGDDEAAEELKDAISHAVESVLRNNGSMGPALALALAWQGVLNALAGDLNEEAA